MSERKTINILDEMLLIQKQIQGMAVKVNWQASRAKSEQKPLLEQMTQWAAYRNSNFIQAEQYLLMRLKGEDKAIDMDAVSLDEYKGIHQILLYYFATNKDLDATKAGGIDDKERAALAAILDKMTAYKKDKAGLSWEDASARAIGIGTHQKPIIYGKTAAMPTSLLVQKQIGISSKSGVTDADGNPVEVGIDINGNSKDKNKEPIIVKASITTQDNKPLCPAAIEIQNVIGEMISANGGTPIFLSKAQIWRAFAVLSSKAPVTKDSLAFVDEIMNTLTETKGKIDFQQQVEKHPAMKKEKGHDYKETTLKGNLVLLDETTSRMGGHETEGYIIYRVPLFYYYSHLIGQIARIDREYLNTTETTITDGQGKKHAVTARKNELVFILLKRHLAREVEAMKSHKATTGSYEGRRNLAEIAKDIGLKETSVEQSRTKQADKNTEQATTSSDKPTAKQMRTLKDSIEWLCQRWRIQGYIKNYTFYTNKGSRAYAGVQIEV